MLIKFYGTRGSIPVCEPEYQTYGGNTPSILIQSENGIGILDAGTGIRNLGKVDFSSQAHGLFRIALVVL